MNNSYYFPHDYDTLQDEKIKRMIRRHGMAGYGLFWAIIELLYANANALRTDYEGIAYDFRVDTSVVKSVICDFGLFVVTDGEFKSQSVDRRLNERKEKSIKARESANYRWSNANALQTDYECNAKNERKNERKNKGNKMYNGEFKNSPIEFSFENVWEQYGKKGNRKTSKAKWDRLSNTNKALALKHIPGYVGATPDKQYRKNFETYLNQEVWNDNLLSNDLNSRKSHSNDSIPDLDILYSDIQTSNKYHG